MSVPAVARLPRPDLRVTAGASPLDQIRLDLVVRVARVRATLAGGRYQRIPLGLLDRALPRTPLPEVAVRIGGRAELLLSGALARGALLTAGYEHRECEIIAAAVRPGGVFVDVGANVGYMTATIAVHRPDATVWAVEPVPATADRLSATVAGLDNVRVHRLMLGRRQGTIDMVETADPAYAHRAGQGSSGTVSCPVETLDRVWSAAGRPRLDAVKIDVEGGEPDVLAGSHAALRACRPLLVVEAPDEPSRAEVTRAVEGLGYRSCRGIGVLPYNTVLAAE